MKTFRRTVLMLMILSAGLVSADRPQDGFIREYRIGPKDLLEIKVQEVPELAGLGVRVSEDGSITLPLAGNIALAGMTRDEVEKLIALLIERNLVKNPRSRCSSGIPEPGRLPDRAVTKPGIYQARRRDALGHHSQAGGFKENAANEIFVLREGKGKAAATIRIDLEDLTVNGNPKLNIPLQPGDVINIPADEVISSFSGAVRNPGALQVKLARINIVQAVAQAGGLTESGKVLGDHNQADAQGRPRVKTSRST